MATESASVRGWTPAAESAGIPTDSPSGSSTQTSTPATVELVVVARAARDSAASAAPASRAGRIPTRSIAQPAGTPSSEIEVPNTPYARPAVWSEAPNSSDRKSGRVSETRK